MFKVQHNAMLHCLILTQNKRCTSFAGATYSRLKSLCPTKVRGVWELNVNCFADVTTTRMYWRVILSRSNMQCLRGLEAGRKQYSMYVRSR